MKNLEFNINSYVLVKLTPKGREILKQQHQDLCKQIGKKIKYVRPREKRGWSRWQLWCLMNELGPECGLGVDPPFETTIILEVQEADHD